MRTLLALFGLFVVACGAPAAHDEPANHVPPTIGAVGEGVAAPGSGTPRLEIHEWGLVDVDLTAQQAELAAGPGQPARPVIARKPVLYLHLLDGDRGAFTIGARARAGAILEHWPAGELATDAITWRVDVRRGVCGGAQRESAMARDLAAALPCATPDGFCEVPELPRYVTSDHDCMTVGGADASLLFYRASTRIDALPLHVARESDLSVRVTATRDLAGAPGSILRISTAMSGPWPVGHVVIARAPLPGAGQSITIPVGTEAIDPARERGALERDLAALGLTPAESQAFMLAWAEALFGVGPATRRWAGMPAMPQDVLLYWMSPASVDAVSTLAIEPGPTVVRRAFLVRIDLGGVETASL